MCKVGVFICILQLSLLGSVAAARVVFAFVAHLNWLLPKRPTRKEEDDVVWYIDDVLLCTIQIKPIVDAHQNGVACVHSDILVMLC